MFPSDSSLPSNVPNNYWCPGCHLIIRNPMQFPCGHRCCQSCLENENGAHIECFDCHEKTARDEIFLDLAFQRDMERSKVDCQSCWWVGIVSNHWADDDENRVKLLIKELFEQRASLAHEEATIKTGVEGNSPNLVAHSSGMFVVKIMQVGERLGLDSFSPTFLTSPSGYQLILSLTVDRGRGPQPHYLSISLHLIRGKHDAILPWPCHFQMVFSLCHLVRQENHFLTSFRSDQHSASFQRPQSAMNIASDIPHFIPLAELERKDSPYIEDDSMFIKILFFQDPVSANLLPSLMSINPALPVHIQKALMDQIRQREMEN